ncbi:unnamed protein product [Adineta ricciae]|uniref:Transposase n=1 Tax=Adineta ricciae TaxID=249248 RepID=A0A814BIT6_ADIRI|nr:unnamed protein product [Adineta ricciae]
MTTESFRFYIKIRPALSISARVIYDELSSVYDREEIEDKARLPRPITETTAENIEQGRLLIDDDPRITVEDIQEHTDLSYGTVQRVERYQTKHSYATLEIKIDDDNGKLHMHKDVADFLELKGLTIKDHPAYSPDLSPCDFCLFDLIKDNRNDQDNSEELHDTVLDLFARP